MEEYISILFSKTKPYKMEEKIADIAKSALKHSVAQTFLVFSGVLVIVSIWSAENNVLVSFFTFYALITRSLTAMRKHESLKNILFRLAYKISQSFSSFSSPHKQKDPDAYHRSLMFVGGGDLNLTDSVPRLIFLLPPESKNQSGFKSPSCRTNTNSLVTQARLTFWAGETEPQALRHTPEAYVFTNFTTRPFQ